MTEIRVRGEAPGDADAVRRVRRPAFQVTELHEGTLRGRHGWVSYIPEFEAVRAELAAPRLHSVIAA